MLKTLLSSDVYSTEFYMHEVEVRSNATTECYNRAVNCSSD